jgi:hypothetical protein
MAAISDSTELPQQFLIGSLNSPSVQRLRISGLPLSISVGEILLV